MSTWLLPAPVHQLEWMRDARMARSGELGKGSKFIVLASVCVVVAALYFAREVLIPLALAVLITFLLTPAVRRLEKWRLGRVASVLIVVIFALSVVGVIGWVVERQFVQIADELPNYKDQIRAKVRRLTGSGDSGLSGAMRKAAKAVEDVAPKAEPPPATAPASQPTTALAADWASAFGTPPTTQAAAASPPRPAEPARRSVIPPIQPVDSTPGAPAMPDVSPGNPLPVRSYPEPPSPVKRAAEYLGMVLDPLATAGLVIVFVIFMLLNREDLRDRMIRLVGFGKLHLTTQAMDDAAVRISRYLVAQSLINACYGVCIAGGVWLVGRLFGTGDRGFPSVLLWGLVAGIFRFIPYIGPWIGAAGPAVVAFGFFPGNGVFFGVLGLFLVLELVVSQVLEPLIYGSSTGLSTLAVLVAAVFWAWLWGPVGLLLSTPLTAVLVVIGKYVPQLQFLGVMLGDEPVLEPPVRIYQRLVAVDQEEAAELARSFLKDRPLVEVYDEVLLPVLALAEQDHSRGQLDDEHFRFVLQAVRAIVDELGDVNRQPRAGAPATTEAGGNGVVARGAPATETTTTTTTTTTTVTTTQTPELPLAIPKGCTVNIVCLPAHDEADEIAGLMLGQLLEERGYCAFVLSQTALASEMVEAVGRREAHVVIVSALPPAAVSHARYLCKRLHGRFGDDFNMLVGLWTDDGDLDKARDRITCAGSVRLTAKLGRALEELHQMAQPAILGAGKPIEAGMRSE